jgi:hypothetical protein
MNAVLQTQPRGRILTCTEEEYFADPCAVPSLSQSCARTLLTESPLHAWTTHPRFGNEKREATKVMDAGTLLHKLLLGAGKEVSVIDAPDFRTKAAQELRDSISASGRLPVLKHALDSARECAAVVRHRMAEVGINMADFDAAMPEVSIEYSEGVGRGASIMCRSRLDKLLLMDDRAVIFDVKKIRDGHPRTCARHMIEYGYDIQHAAYISAVQAVRPDLAGRIDFIFIFFEDGSPYAVTPARPDGVLREHGDNRWFRACQLWHKCTTSNHWPGYVESPISLEAPTWAISQELGNHDRI